MLEISGVCMLSSGISVPDYSNEPLSSLCEIVAH